VSQSFSFPSVYAKQSRSAKAAIQSSKLDLTVKRSELSAQVKNTYWQLSFFYSKRDLLNYQDSLCHGFVYASKRRASSGETTMLEQLTAETQDLEIENQMHQNQADIDIYKGKLALLINMQQPVLIYDTILKKLEISLTADSSALAGNPELASYNQQVEVARANTGIEKARLMPDIELGYFNKSIIGDAELNGQMQHFNSSDRFKGFQGGISVPILFGAQNSRIKASRIQEKIAFSEAEIYKSQLLNEFHTQYQEFLKNKSSVEYYEKSALHNADHIIAQATKSYRAGALDYIDYIQSVTRALEVKRTYLETLNEYNQAVINLEFIIGKTN